MSKLASEGIAKLGSSLGLIAAGAVALWGFNKLSGALKEVREEAERSRKALEDFHKAQTDLQRGPMESAADVVAERDRSGLTPFTAAQAKSIEETLAAVPEAQRKTLAPMLSIFGGGKGIGEGGELTGDELMTLGRLGFQPQAEPDRDIVRALRGMGIRPRLASPADRARAFLAQRASDVSRIRERDRSAADARRQAAVREALHPEVTGGQANLRGIVEEQAAQFGVDPAIVQSEVEGRLGRESVIGMGGLPATPPRFIQDRPGPQLPDVEMQGGETREMTGQEAGAIDSVLRELSSAADRMADAAEQIAATPPQVVNNNQNQRHTYPSARAQREAQTNGESKARAAEY